MTRFNKSGLGAMLGICALGSMAQTPDDVADKVLSREGSTALTPATDVKANEIIRKQQQLLEADRLSADARILLKMGKFEEAEKKATAAAALYQLASSAAAEPLAKTAATQSLLAQINAEWAQSLYRQSVLADDPALLGTAIGKLQFAKEKDPAIAKDCDAKISAFLAVKEKLEYAAAVGAKIFDAEKKNRDEQVKVLMDRAMILIEDRQYTQAREQLDQIFILDPMNTEAAYLGYKINQQIRRTGAERRNAFLADLNADSTFRWSSPVAAGGAEQGVVREAGQISRSEDRSLIHQKLGLVIPSLKYEDEPLENVLQDLRARLKKLDPEKRGINIVFLRTNAAPVATAAPAAVNDPFAAAAPAEDVGPAPAAVGAYPVSLAVDDMTIGGVLKSIAELHNLILKVEDNAVIIAEEGVVGLDVMRTEFFTVPPGVLDVIATAKADSLTGEAAADAGGEKDWKATFTDLGIAFPPGAKAEYVAQVSRLVVTNTSENLKLLDDLLRSLTTDKVQILIESKVADLKVNNTEELGAMWRYTTPNMVQHANGVNAFNSDPLTPRFMFPQTTTSARLNANIRDVQAVSNRQSTPNPVQLAADVVLGHEQFQMMIRALDQQDSVDLLSAPRVMAQSGGTAVIRVVTERWFPEDWEKPEINSGGIMPSAPIYGDKVDLGFLMEVTPELDPDNYTIALAVVPQVVEFKGYDRTFDRYMVTGALPVPFDPNNLSISGMSLIPVPNSIAFIYSMPIFEKRVIDTKVKVWDGETVVLGGLMREDIVAIDDSIPYISKIPLLGRLFQNKGTRSEKRATMVFISARLMNSAGVPLRQNNIRGLPDFKRI